MTDHVCYCAECGREMKIEHTHRCIACQFEYTPVEGTSEDCPNCGCDGVTS